MKEKDLEKLLKALANHRRLAMLRFIKKKKEANVGAIAEEIKLSFKSTSRHLSILIAINFLDKEQRSSEVFYKINTKIPELVRYLINFL